MTETWIKVADLSQIFDGSTLKVQGPHDAVCLYNLDGTIHATSDLCTHGAASLSDGWIEGDRIECPFHQGLFHIPTGKAVGAPCVIDVRTYPVKVEGTAIFLAR